MEKEDRYTRLKALKEFGYNVDWDILNSKHVIICGIGGIGSVSAEMLTRCGIGKLSLIDFDIVEEVNLNRLCFCEEDIGQSKVKVISKNLKKINNHVKVVPYHTDVCSPDFEQEFEKLLKVSNLLLMGLDNEPARQYVNIKCVKSKLPFIDAGASRSGLSGYVHLVLPKKSACYACTGSIDLGKIDKGEPCTASLPTTMAIIASIQTEHALKFFLPLGPIPDYITYNGYMGTFKILKQNRDIYCPICGDKTRKSRKIEPRINREEIKKLIKELEDI